MFGLCFPEGELYLLLNNGKKETIMQVDLARPKQTIMNDKYVFNAIKRNGYNNVKEIVYEYDSKKTIISMADYYAEYGLELEEN